SGSGGGLSDVEAQPSYQQGVVTQSSTQRASPDVSYDADPNTGFPVYDSFNNGSAAPWSQFGGTSDAAPQWAGLIALADQGRIANGLSPLDGPSQTLPMIYGLSSSDFRDITTGSSTGSPRISASAGYDEVTGRGSPIANRAPADPGGGNIVPAAPRFVVSPSSPSTAGNTLSVTVSAVDSTGKTVTSFLGAVSLSSNDLQAVLPSAYTFTAADKG